MHEDIECCVGVGIALLRVNGHLGIGVNMFCELLHACVIIR